MPTFKRLVKLTFKADKINDFMAIFEESSPSIRAFPGCMHLELWQARQESNVLFTFSLWNSEEALHNYRHSELFQTTWAKTKVLFDDKPQAWSVDELANLDDMYSYEP